MEHDKRMYHRKRAECTWEGVVDDDKLRTGGRVEHDRSRSERRVEHDK